MIGRLGPGIADTNAIIELSEDFIDNQTNVGHVLDGRGAIVVVVGVTLVHPGCKASEPLKG